MHLQIKFESEQKKETVKKNLKIKIKKEKQKN